MKVLFVLCSRNNLLREGDDPKNKPLLAGMESHEQMVATLVAIYSVRGDLVYEPFAGYQSVCIHQCCFIHVVIRVLPSCMFNIKPYSSIQHT